MDGQSDFIQNRDSPLGEQHKRKPKWRSGSVVLNFQIIPDTFIFFLYYHIFGSLGGSEF